MQLPPLFNMPKSQLQCYGESVYCINEDYLTRCPRGKSSLERFTSVVAWSISTMRPAIFGLAPFDPILGETHHVSRGSLNVLLEQVTVMSWCCKYSAPLFENSYFCASYCAFQIMCVYISLTNVFIISLWCIYLEGLTSPSSVCSSCNWCKREHRTYMVAQPSYQLSWYFSATYHSNSFLLIIYTLWIEVCLSHFKIPVHASVCTNWHYQFHQALEMDYTD